MKIQELEDVNYEHNNAASHNTWHTPTKNCGYRCISASNGQEALNILDREYVDLILTDLSMPVLDGYRTTQLIRERPAMANVPIVAVTAYALNDENEAALQIGCNEYLTKPFKPRQLLEVVDRLLPHE